MKIFSKETVILLEPNETLLVRNSRKEVTKIDNVNGRMFVDQVPYKKYKDFIMGEEQFKILKELTENVTHDTEARVTCCEKDDGSKLIVKVDSIILK